MDDIILISNLNDFIFCPVSIYFHGLYGGADVLTFQTKSQLNGTKAHESLDTGKYSTRKDIVTGLDVYSDKYRLVGKIDMYDSRKKMLVERKKHVSRIYDGYVFQLYGQYYSMIDMGYAVDSLRIHSIDDNKNYNIDLPENDKDMKNRFEQLISDMRAFDMDKFVQENSQKCANCIYEDACDRSVSRGD